MKIEDRVRLAFDLGINKEFLPMLSFALPAIEASAKKKYGRGGRASFIKLIRENYEVFHWFSGSFLDFVELRFPTLDPSLTDGQTVDRPDLAQVLYYLHRCSLAHGQELGESCSILPRKPDGSFDYHIDKVGKGIRLPEPIAWGVLATVVLEPINTNLESRSGNYFTLSLPPITYFLNVDLFWGAKDRLKRVVEKYDAPPDQTQSVMSQLSI
ncbi:MAG: hypothetical protein C0524_07470 [Rhodobacter sp.]|nr:hypothetical protein [Rhodobacter sp.]